jgi:methionine-S-sulfoxide reductase
MKPGNFNIAAKPWLYVATIMGMFAMSALANANTTAIFAGGCFWCMESEFQEQPGVVSVVSGYTGGDAASARYDMVSAKKTQHVEAVEVAYDPAKTSYQRLLDIYWGNIDPTDAGGQFYDRGAHYATVIYYGSDEEKALAEASKAKAEAKLGKPVATRIEQRKPFYAAEAEHQDFYKTNSGHYERYVAGSGRKEKLKDIWGK